MRSIIRSVSISKSYYQSSSRLTYIVSHRHQSTKPQTPNTTEDDSNANLLQSDQSILNELQSFELSEDELIKISDGNGVTIVDGIEYLQPSGIMIII